MTRRIRFLASALAAALFLVTGTAAAQGKGAGRAKETAAEPGAPAQKKLPPGQAKKVTTDQAVVVARDVLTNNGYRVVRVERVDGAQVIWYRRGNMGNGKGQGPLEKMVVRPASSIVKLEMTGSAAELGRTIGERLGIW